MIYCWLAFSFNIRLKFDTKSIDWVCVLNTWCVFLNFVEKQASTNPTALNDILILHFVTRTNWLFIFSQKSNFKIQLCVAHSILMCSSKIHFMQNSFGTDFFYTEFAVREICFPFFTLKQNCFIFQYRNKSGTQSSWV